MTHYFSNKDELLLHAYRFVARQAGERLDRFNTENPGDLVGSLLLLSAADESSFIGWRVYVAFWEKAKLDPAFAAEQRAGVEDARRWIGAVVRDRYGDRADGADAVQMLITVLHGISVQALFDPESWSQDRIRETLTMVVELILAPDRT